MSTNKVVNKSSQNSNELCESQSGAIYFMKVDGRILKSDVPLMKALDIVALAGLNVQTHILVKIFKGDCKEILDNSTIVDLNNYGVEDFKTEKILVEVFYKEQGFLVRSGNHSVKDLKKVLGVPQAHHLSVLINNELKPLDDDGAICIVGGEHFVSYPCDGKAS